VFGAGFTAATNGPKLSSFAGGSGPKIQGLSSKRAKAFGAAEESDVEEEDTSEGEGADESQAKSPREEEIKKDKRFYEQDLSTGEENETTIFSARAKLYSFITTDKEKKWVERGVGALKLNVPSNLEPEGEDASESDVSTKKARFVMRADGSHRVVLNSPVQKGSTFGQPGNERPKGMTLMFLGRLEGGEKLETLQLKMKAESAGHLYDVVQDLQKDL